MKETEKRKGLRHSLFLGAMVLAALLITMPMLGCDPDDGDVHKHEYEQTFDDVQHWQKCQCGATIHLNSHVYDDESDTTCNVCDFVRTGHMHVWEDTWNTDDRYHWLNCSVSGCTAVNKSAHALIYAYVTDESHHWFECTICHHRCELNAHKYRNDSDPKCDSCGYVRNVVHVHEWVRDYGDYQHWYKCQDCPETKDYEDHQFGSKLSADKEGYHYYPCIKCNYEGEKDDHKYKWKYNAASHWKECICGRKISRGVHVYDDASDPSCNTCSYIRKLHEHAWQTDWTKDKGFHWHDCTVEGCKEVKDYAAHSYTFKPGINGHFGECICGQKTQTEDHVYDNEWDSTCNLCGHLRYIYIPTPDPIVPPHTHTWGWANDADYHWKKCSGCGEVSGEEKAKHDYPLGSGNYTSDATCHWIECETCSYEQPGSKIEHSPSTIDNVPDWYYDDAHHWQKCSGCGYKMNLSSHDSSSADGTCSVCGHAPTPVPTP